MPRSPNPPVRKLLILTYHRLDLWIAPPWFAERLAAEFPQFQVIQLNSYDRVLDEIGDIEIMFGISIRPDQFLTAKKLRWIHSQAAAVHQLMFPELINSKVVITNAREVHGAVVAEHVLALIFALAKKIPAAVRFQQQHVWGQEQIWHGDSRPRDIAGATLGLVGLGSIGRPLAKHAAALGMNVIAVRKHSGKNRPEGVDEIMPTTRLEEMLARSDYVVLAAPVTLATTGLIGWPQLTKMKPGAFLINVSRGPLVNQDALIEALRSRTLAGAALDVFDQEPLPADSPLWELENVLITPHTAGMSDQMWQRHYTLFSENLRRYLDGQSLLGLVNKRRGY